MKGLLAVIFLILVTIPTIGVMASDNPSLLHVYYLNKSDIDVLARLHLDIPYHTAEYAEVVAYAEDIERINALGLRYDIIHEDLVAFYQSRNPVNTTMGGFLTYPEIVDSLDVLHANYPNLVSEKFSIGQSWEGRDLWVFKISDNVDIDEDEPEVFYNSLIHAREPASWAWIHNYISWLLANYGTDETATAIINERELYFLPVSNPDGYEYNRQTNPSGGGMWRKNRRSGGGVDLNRNWGYMWGYDNDGSSPYSYDETYRGPSAFSEPETQAVRDFIYDRDFQIILNGHCYGNWFLYPYSYNGSYTTDHVYYRALGDTAEALTGEYVAGTCNETLHYFANGEATDWQYGMQGIFSIVTETGRSNDGFWPAQYRIPQLNEQMLPLAKFISQIAGNIRALVSPVAPVLSPIGDLDTNTFTVSWMHDDEYNPAVAYELIEKSGFTRVTDDLESGSDNWVFDGFLLRTTRYHSPSHSIYSGNQNNYNGSAMLAEDIGVQAGDTLTFWTYYDIENNFDYAYVKVSTDGGVTYTPIAGNITTNNNPNGNNQGNGITGSSNNQWVNGIFPLDDFAGLSVRIKLCYVTDGSVLGAGIYFDDIYPIDSFASEIVLSSDITDTSYLVEDREDGTYYYQVRARDAEDQWSGFSNREQAVVDVYVSVDLPAAAPFEFALGQNYPNPFNATTRIEFGLGAAARVRLEIFDIAGRLIKELIDQPMSAGAHSVVWDGKNTDSETVATGVYFYKLTAGGKSEIKAMTLLK